MKAFLLSFSQKNQARRYAGPDFFFLEPDEEHLHFQIDGPPGQIFRKLDLAARG